MHDSYSWDLTEGPVRRAAPDSRWTRETWHSVLKRGSFQRMHHDRHHQHGQQSNNTTRETTRGGTPSPQAPVVHRIEIRSKVANTKPHRTLSATGRGRCGLHHEGQ